MLYYERIHISNGIGPTKSNRSKKYMTFHCWLFNHGFKFQYSICSGCHNLTMLNVNISNVAIKNVNYC